jgi:ribosomal-protein-alanine N-acetyltransferase
MPSRIYLRRPTLADGPEFLTAARRSRLLHSPWISAPSTPEEFRAYVERSSQPAHHGFLICRRDDGRIAGVVNITNVVLGAFQSGYLSYYAMAGHERQALMKEGLGEVIRYAFRTLKLHRLEANIQPENAASIALVRSCGFSREGYSPKYLKIGGRWRDHERWALLAS